MTRKIALTALTLCSLMIAAGCKPQAPAEPATTEEASAEVAPAAPEATPTPMAAESAEDVPFDTKGFAGVFTGTLPCADCAGIDANLSLNRDGTYKIHESYQGKAGNGMDSDGTWTPEENGKRIRLDPNSKGEQDRLFAIVSQEQLDQLDTSGNPIDTQAPHSLKRTGAAMQ